MSVENPIAPTGEESPIEVSENARGQFDAYMRAPSTFVTKDLIRALEQYLARRSAEAFPNNADTRLRVLIIDPLGVETLATIADFLPLRFTDATKAVRIRLLCSSHRPRQELDVAIAFARQREHSVIGVTYTGRHAREFVQGLLDGLRQCLSPNHARTGIYNPLTAAQGLIGGLSTGLLMLLPLTFTFLPTRVFAANVAVACVGWFFVVMPYIRPYCLIDTARNDRLQQNWKWLRNLIIGFVVSGVALSALKDKLISML